MALKLFVIKRLRASRKISTSLKWSCGSIKVLGIETSCDDTAVAVIDGRGHVLSEVVESQHSIHCHTKGIVPYMAAAAHRASLPKTIASCLETAGVSISDINAFAATKGPGLGGCLSVGFETAHLFSTICKKPFVPVHHMEAHALAAMMNNNVSFPFLCLLISGGHTILAFARDIGEYTILGTTLDDSVGEAIDKASRMLEFPYSAEHGPAKALVNAASAHNSKDPRNFFIPRSQPSKDAFNFSFSGPKTALADLVYELKKTSSFTNAIKAELAATFIESCADQISERIVRAAKIHAFDTLVIGGGVARNTYLMNRILINIKSIFKAIHWPKPQHCTDNAAMVAYTALQYLQRGKTISHSPGIMQSWPLDILKFSVLSGN